LFERFGGCKTEERTSPRIPSPFRLLRAWLRARCRAQVLDAMDLERLAASSHAAKAEAQTPAEEEESAASKRLCVYYLINRRLLASGFFFY